MSLLHTRALRVLSLLIALLVFSRPIPAVAQESITLVTNMMMYGDNTEFFNQFRDGNTLLGAAGSLAFDVALTDRVTFRGGLFLNHRFGSKHFLEQWRPVISLSVDKGPSRFTFGTFDTISREQLGADLIGPHGLLPPLQVETLAFTRPYESGVQWQLTASRITQETWVNWQQLNTADHRERFDAGLKGRIPLDTDLPIAIAYQMHHVHEGGQLFDSGTVNDSFAGGPGIIVEPLIDFFDLASFEAYAMWSKDVADRADGNGTNHGHGIFTRAALIKNGWRSHLIGWRACAWLKDEGDRNYGSWLPNDVIFRPTRNYVEVGLAKAFYEAAGVVLQGAARLHRVEKDYDYSFRVLAQIDFAVPIMTR